MQLCIVCNKNPRRFERRKCNTCISAEARARRRRKSNQPDQIIPTGDLFLDELISAFRAMNEGTFPLISDGMTT